MPEQPDIQPAGVDDTLQAVTLRTVASDYDPRDRLALPESGGRSVALVVVIALVSAAVIVGHILRANNVPIHARMAPLFGDWQQQAGLSSCSRSPLQASSSPTARWLPAGCAGRCCYWPRVSRRRLGVLRQIPRDGVALQVSVDSATPELHDLHRGTGSWQRAMDGVRIARAEGFRVRVAATVAAGETNQAELTAFHRLLDDMEIPTDDRIGRPVAQRGFAESGVTLVSSP